MKILSVSSIIIILALMFCGCGKKVSSGIDSKKNEGIEIQPAVIGMPNPVRDSTVQDILNTFGIRFALPEGAENARYSVIGGTLSQVDFTWNGDECTARAEPSGETSLKDISGFYYNWKNSAEVKVGYNTAKASWTKDEKGNSVGICIWWDAAPGIMYSVSMRSGAGEKSLSALANAVYVPVQGEN